mmetsp:Transcript_20767/g.67332  ORF Transcript_20767/g.67332 Transcript_20767/m.67332 type:complete len:707 (-) Transcript_20767:3-2123(-)
MRAVKPSRTLELVSRNKNELQGRATEPQNLKHTWHGQDGIWDIAHISPLADCVQRIKIDCRRPTAPVASVVRPCQDSSLLLQRIRPRLCVLLHCLGQMCLVGLDVAFPDLDAFVADPDLVCDLIDESEVVANQHTAAGEGLDGICEGIDALHVQAIRRLIKQQHVRVHQRDQAEHNARLLTIRHGADLPCLQLATHAVLSELCPPTVEFQFLETLGGHDAFRILLLHELQRSLVVRQDLRRVLVVAADPQVAVPLDLALGSLELTTHQFQQGGLASSVRAHQGDATVQVDSEGNLVVQVVLLLARIREAHIVERQDWWRQLLGHRKPELVLGIILRLLNEALLLHLVDDFLLGLCLLPQVREGTARPDEIQQVLDVLLFLLVGLELVDLTLKPRLHIGSIVATPIHQLVVHRELHDLGADTVQEVFGVRCHNDGRGVGGQVLLEPNTGTQVQVVRGLVQNEQRRLLEECLCERHTHSPATGHVLRRLVHHGLSEAKAVEQGTGLGFEELWRHLVHLVAESLHDICVLLGVLFAELLDQCFDTLVLLQRHIHHGFQGRVVGGVCLLVHVPDVDVVRDWQLTSRDACQKSGLATAVGTDETIAPAVIEDDGRVLNELLPVHRHCHLLDSHIARLRSRGQDTSDVHSVEDFQSAGTRAKEHLLLLGLIGLLRQDLFLVILAGFCLGFRLAYGLCGTAHSAKGIKRPVGP